MTKCDHCGEQCNLPFHCSYCGGSYCSDHRLPPSHNCIHEAGWRSRTSKRYDVSPKRESSTLPQSECFFCGVKTSKISYCPLCGHDFCSLHKLHQDHFRETEKPREPLKPSNPTKGKHAKGPIGHHILVAIFVILAIMGGIFFAFGTFFSSAGSETAIVPITSQCVTENNFNISTITPTAIPTAMTEAMQQHAVATQILQPVDTIPVQNYETGGSTDTFNYILRGKTGFISTTLYQGVANQQLSTPIPATCMRYVSDPAPCTQEEIRIYYLKYLNEPYQEKGLNELVEQIKFKTSNRDDQARIAISLVQNIPYDYAKLHYDSSMESTKYPYHVLYENHGLCGEKSLLLAYLLRELGYGVVLFEFNSEKHMAVGIQSPIQYSYANSGYAFIESTSPAIITDSQGDYAGAGKLTSTPKIIRISNGSSMTSILEEYNDARTFHQVYDQITQLHDTYGTVLDRYQYSRWLSLDNQLKTLCNNYGIKILTSP